MVVEGHPPADPLAGLAPAREGMQVGALVLQRAPQPLDKDVVEEAAATIHRDAYAGLLQALRPGPGGEPAALVGVEDLRPAVALARLAQGDVRRLLDQCQDFLGMGFDPVRATIPALRPWPDMARPPPPIDLFDRRRRRDPEALRRRAT